MPIVASEVMDESRAYLNDVPASLYDNETLLPYLKIAYRQYQVALNLLSNPDTEEISTILTVLSGSETLAALPNDFVTPIKIEELENNQFWPMKKVEYLPNDEQKTRLHFWNYREGNLFFSKAMRDVTIKLYYVKRLNLIDESTQFPIESSIDYLSAKTASLAAKFIGGNKTLSDEILGEAEIALERDKKRIAKGNQGFGTRRIPFWIEHRHGEHSDGF